MSGLECRTCLFNHQTRAWDEVKPNEAMANPGNYVNGEGEIFVQFRSDSQDMYAEAPMPMINLQGRLEHAEN